MSIQKVISYAVSQIGYTEGANNDNKFAAIAKHRNNQPWCDTFFVASFIEGEEKDAVPNTASVIETLKWAKKNNRVIPIEKAKRGDGIIQSFDGGKTPMHIELAAHDFDVAKKMIQCVGGNTGKPGDSQNNGDGVYRKNRTMPYLFVAFRPMYKDPNESKID